MNSSVTRHALALSTALTLSLGGASALAQITPGDQSGTPTAAGAGQSAASSTNAPASVDQTSTDATQPAIQRAPAARSRGDDTNPGDIIVTARRVEERLQDVPISITVFNQQQLENRNIFNATDLATYTPSLSASTAFGQDNTSFALRGFYQDIGTAPSVGVYFADVVAPRGASNGIPSGDGAGPGNYFDLQNIQVLKGPQGTLFGRNTTGGAILFVPQKPTSKLEGFVEGSYGSYDLKRIQGAVNIPLGDRFRMRFAGDHQSRDGYLFNRNTAANAKIGPDRFGDVDYTSVRASFVADLTPDLENYTIASYTHSSNNGSFQKLFVVDPTFSLGTLANAQLNGSPISAPTQGPGFYDVTQDDRNPSTRINQWQVINTTTWRASDTITVKNIASYAQFTEYFRNPIFGTNFIAPALLPVLNAITGQAPGTFVVGPTFTGSVPLPNGNTANQNTITEEVQLQGRSADDRLNYQAGAYYELSQPLSVVGSQSPVALGCTDSANFQCQDLLGALGGAPAGSVNYTSGQTRFRNVGVYTQATYKITDQFKVTGGIRYTWDRSTNTSQQLTYGGFPPYIANPAYDPTVAGSQQGVRGRSAAIGGPGYVVCTYADSSNATALNANPSTSLAALNLSSDCFRSFKRTDNKPTWLIDLDYTPTEDILLYAKYARGFRAGTIAPNISASFVIVQPEKVDSYEVGAKTSLRGPLRATFNVAGFYNDFRHQQVQLGFNDLPGDGISVAPTASPVNLDKSRIYGAEVEASITPFRGLTLDGSYTYLNATVRKIPDNLVNGTAVGPYLLSGVPFHGDRLPLSPKNKFTVSGNYTLPLDESIGRISFGANYTYVSSQLSNYNDRLYVGSAASDPDTVAALQNAGNIPHYHLVNVNAGWNSIFGTPVDLSFFMTNVTKEKYITYTPGIALGTGIEVATLGAPRMYGGRLRVRFGN